MWALMQENNKGSDQPVHLQSLITALFILYRKISVLELVSAAEQTGLSLILSETSKTGFLAKRPNNCGWYFCLKLLFPLFVLFLLSFLFKFVYFDLLIDTINIY